MDFTISIRRVVITHLRAGRMRAPLRPVKPMICRPSGALWLFDGAILHSSIEDLHRTSEEAGLESG